MAVTGSWNQVGTDVYYRKLEVFTMDWHAKYAIDLRDYKAKVSPFGGPIGNCR